MEEKEIIKLVDGISSVVDFDLSEEAFEGGSDEYFFIAKRLVEPNLCGAKIDEKIMEGYHDMIENNPEGFLSILNSFGSQWVRFGELFLEYGY